MDHRVALAFEDGVTRFITCRDDQTVADASYRARINIPLDCRDGACGTCKSLCESGEFDGGTYLEDALSEDEAASGYVLPCSMKPRSDLVLQIPTTSAVAKTSAATHRGSITALDRLSPTTVGLTIEIDDRDALAFLPGQYVNIAVPGTEESRSCSFSSAPQDKALTFLMKLAPGGVMSTYLDERAQVGDEITFTGPHGSFFLRESDAPLLLLAGGTGLAPVLAILRTLDAGNSSRRMHLVYGVTTDDDLVEMDAIAQLAGSIDGLTWDYCVADPATKAPNQGYVTGLMGPEHLHDGTAAVYLCGPPAMVEAVRTYVGELGVTPLGFYYEKFALAAPPAPAAEEDGEPQPELPVEPPLPVVVPDTVSELLTLAGREGRNSAGQVLLPPVDLPPVGAGAAGRAAESPADMWPLAGQPVGEPTSTGEVSTVDEVDELLPAAGARAVAGQEMLPESALEQLVLPPAPSAAGAPDVEVEATGATAGRRGPALGTWRSSRRSPPTATRSRPTVTRSARSTRRCTSPMRSSTPAGPWSSGRSSSPSGASRTVSSSGTGCSPRRLCPTSRVTGSSTRPPTPRPTPRSTTTCSRSPATTTCCTPTRRSASRATWRSGCGRRPGSTPVAPRTTSKSSRPSVTGTGSAPAS